MGIDIDLGSYLSRELLENLFAAGPFGFKFKGGIEPDVREVEQEPIDGDRMACDSVEPMHKAQECHLGSSYSAEFSFGSLGPVRERDRLGVVLS